MRKIPASSNAAPMICIPSGSPSELIPHGIESAGKPSALTPRARRVVASLIPRSGECCRFWTTTVAFVESEGPLGRIWLEIGSSQPGLVALNALPGTARSDRPVEHCIGKPAWWEHRPGGGEGA